MIDFIVCEVVVVCAGSGDQGVTCAEVITEPDALGLRIDAGGGQEARLRPLGAPGAASEPEQRQGPMDGIVVIRVSPQPIALEHDRRRLLTDPPPWQRERVLPDPSRAPTDHR